MSADDWVPCPLCIKKYTKLKDDFIKTYYGKISVEDFLALRELFEDASKHTESYESKSFKATAAQEELLNRLKIELNGETIYSYDLNQESGTPVRIDKEDGFDEDGNVYLSFKASCSACDFEREVSYDAKIHEIKEKKKK